MQEALKFTDQDAALQGFIRLEEYPGKFLSVGARELEQWSLVLDLAGIPRKGRHHPPMEWMVHRHLVSTDGVGVEGYLGNTHHFMKMCDFFFNREGSLFPVQWNPNTLRILEAFFSHKFISLLGSASAGKSYGMALIGAGMFMLDPANTKVLVTCTTLQAGKGKIWGDLCNAWNQIERVFGDMGLPLPGKLMSEPPMIRYQCPAYSPQKGWHYTHNSHKAGLELIATLQSSEKQAVASVQGYKNETVIFLGDEWDTFSPALVTTVTANLDANPRAKCIASFNISGRFSSGGKIATPKHGWDSVTPDDVEWDGEFGRVLRFDALRSPNVLEVESGEVERGSERWKGLPTVDYIEHQKSKYGEDSVGWWMYVRAWPPPSGDSNFIYSDVELTLQYHCDHQIMTWLGQKTLVAGGDPDFTHNGDGATLAIGLVGMAQINGVNKVAFELVKVIELTKFINLKDQNHATQVAVLFRRFLGENGVGLKNCGFDLTGADSFGDLLNTHLGVGWHAIKSTHAATSLVHSSADTRPCHEVFDSLISEMWLAPKALIRGGQIKGLDDPTIREMCSRCFKMSNERGLQQVESKRDMKKRTRKMSPNRADALFIALQIARQYHGLLSTEKHGGPQKPQAPLSQMQQFYKDNPHLKPKKTFAKNPRSFPPLKTSSAPW